METIRTSTTYFIPPGKFLLMENALGNPDLIQSSVSNDCRVTIVDTANFPLDELEQWPTFRLTSSDVKLKLGEGLYYVYIVVPTPDNSETTTAFISYNTVKVDRKGYDADGKLLGKEKFCYYQCGTVSARGGNPSVVTTPSGQGRVIEMDLGVTPAPSTLPGDLNDFDKMFQLDKVDPNNPKSWLLTILATVKSMTARLVRITGSLVFGSGESEKVVTDVALSGQSADANSVSDSILPTTAWVDARFLCKDRDDHTPHSLSVGKNLTVDGTLYAERMQSSDFAQGSLMGSGWSVYKDANGNTVVETDTIIARKGINASELVVNQETFEKGSSIFVKGGCAITKVEEVDGKYRCFYDNENGKRFSGFKVGDQARCQRYDSSYGVKIKYYWRLVVGVADDYVELSMTDFDGEGVPEEGDDIAQLGNRTDKTRQSAIVISPDNGGSVVVWAGIDSYNLSERNMCGMGVNPNNGRAYIYGYGDMFFGDRNLEKNFITYQIKDGDTEPTLTINADVHLSKDSTGLGNLTEFEEIKNNVDYLNNQIEREFTIWYFDDEPTLENEPAVNWVTDELKAMHDQDLYFSDALARAWRFVNGSWVEVTDERTLAALKLADEAQKAATEAKNYINNVLPKQLEGLQNQIDGTIESYFYKYDPSLDNYPANEWITEEQKEAHLNDTFTNLESGYSWRWTKEIIPSEEEGVEPSVLYKWIEIADTATVKALAVAGKAQDTADGKRRVFVETPFTPYNVGDLWVQGETGDIMRCAVERLSGEYAESDWVKASKYTDDSSLENFIKGEYANQLKEIASQLDARAETWYQEEDPSSAWDSDALKAVHKGDLWYKISTNQTYMWTGTGWVSQGVSDEVFDLIDGKAAIFVSQPIPPYNIGDLWVQGSEGDILRCKKPKAKGEEFESSDWVLASKYTDDSALQSFIENDYKNQLASIQSQMDKRAETWYQVEDPSLAWTTQEIKQLHAGDLWYNINKGLSYMWSGTEWVIQGVPDEVFDTIDGKASIYTSQPSSYKKNDLWILSSDTTLDKAYNSGTIVVAKQDSDTFVASHWTKKDRYTDDSALETFLNGAYKEQLEAIQSQIDSRSETWYQVEDPSLLWNTDDLKQLHIGDLWYSINDKQSFMWTGTEWIVQGVPDEVFDKIDGKAEIFVSKPTKYNRNDLWFLGEDITLDKAYKAGVIVVATSKSDVFNPLHWTKFDKYTDDTLAQEALKKAESFSDDLSGVLADMEIVKGQVDREFTIWYYDAEPTLYNEPAVNWNTQALIEMHDQDIYFSDSLARAWRFVDGRWIEITDARTIAALEKAQEAMDKASDFDYLKETFGKNENVLEGGVIMSKLVSVVNDDSQVEAFINGSDFAEDETNGKLLIAGGIPEKASDGSANLDKRASEAAYRLYENGAGSYANGNIRWTKYGTTYRKAPDFIVWTFVRNTFGENEVIDLTKGCYLDLSSYVDHQLWMPFGLPEDMTVFVRYHQASRSDYCATIQGAFYAGTEQVDGIRIDESDDGQPFELNYDKTKNRWSYRGGYYVRDGIAYLIKDASTTITTPPIEGYTGSFTINGSNGNYALSFENGLLKTYKYTNTSGGN